MRKKSLKKEEAIYFFNELFYYSNKRSLIARGIRKFHHEIMKCCRFADRCAGKTEGFTMRLSDGGKRMLLITAFLATAVCSFCGGHFAAEYGQSKYSDVYYVSAEAAVDSNETQASADPEKTENPDLWIDINTATAEELDRLDGIGPALAERIIAHREEFGPFKHAFEIMDVSGIGNHLYDKIKDNIYVS